MVDQSEGGSQGWDYNLPGELCLDLDPFASIGIDNLFTDELWGGAQAPILHGPIASHIDPFLGSALWLDSQPFALHSAELNRTNGVSMLIDFDMSFSYQMDHKSESLTNSSSSGLATPFTPLESSISPAQVLSQPIPLRPRGPRKRRIEDFQSKFMGPRPTVTDKRRRQPFKDERRLEVGAVRKAGASIRCRLMKAPCNFGLPCEKCMKHWDDPCLSQVLCAHPRLLDVQMNSTKPDLWDRKHDIRWLKRNVTLLQGSRRVVELSLVNFCDIISIVRDRDSWLEGHDGPWKPVAPLQIVVQSFEPGLGREMKHFLNVTFAGSKETILTAPSYYAIPPDSLPTLEELSKWVLDSTEVQRRSIFDEGLQGSFMSLARRYSKCRVVLPLCSALPEPKNTRNEAPRYASKAVHKQIAVIVTQGIESFEHDILKQLQAIIFNQKGIGNENDLPVWICLWLLILTYRRTISHWSSRRNRESYLGLAQHMYNMLISTYSTIFRHSTPLWHNFLKDDVFEMFGRNHSVTERMGVVKTEMEYTHRGDKDFHDKLLRTLIFELEKKLGEEAGYKAMELLNLQPVT